MTEQTAIHAGRREFDGGVSWMPAFAGMTSMESIWRSEPGGGRSSASTARVGLRNE